MGSMMILLKQSYWVFGLLGCMVITMAIAGTALAYRGIKGQRYSFLNHYISELGEVGVSRKARLFNSGMILTGLFFMPFTLGLGLTLGRLWGFLGTLAGLWTGIACLLVGVYPMNNLTPHSRVATAYFRGGLATVLFFSTGHLLAGTRGSSHFALGQPGRDGGRHQLRLFHCVVRRGRNRMMIRKWAKVSRLLRNDPVFGSYRSSNGWSSLQPSCGSW